MDKVDTFLWVEKYRPQKIKDCILPNSIKDTFEGIVRGGRIPHLLLTGTAGTGKTTAAKALCNEIGADYIFINASNENGIDVLRTKITQFASTVSFSDSKKVVILDESDYLSANGSQPALRNFMEQYSDNCTFIMTCNFKNRLIAPLHSRCTEINFKISAKEKPAVAAAFFKRVTDILTEEGVEFDKKVVAEVIQKHFPDYRKILNEMQRYSVNGKIDAGILVDISEESYNSLITSIKNRKFNDVRKWVANHSDEDSTIFFRNMYDRASLKLEPKSLPSFILLLGKYSYQDAFVADKEINCMAFLTEVMLTGDIQWKE
jgi:DNA polymerase III delta prime subunit